MDFFLDSNILFKAIKSKKIRSQINHIINTKNRAVTSITVLGETIAICIGEKSTEDLDEIIILNHDLKLVYHFPNPILRQCCICVDKISPRRNPSITDKTHLAYAIANSSDYLVTTDKLLLKFPLKKLECKEKCNMKGLKGIIPLEKIVEVLK